MPSLWQTIQQAMSLNQGVFTDIQRAPGGLGIALIIVSLAGLSESLGQSVILFLNRLPPTRFILALFITAASHVVGYCVWTVTVWLVGVYIFGQPVTLTAVACVVGLAYAPQLLAFFELTPFLGNPFSILLTLWSMVAIVMAIHVGLALELWQAVLASGLGWVLIQIWRRTIGRPIYALGRWLQRRAAGVPMELTLSDLGALRRHPAWLENLDVWRTRIQPKDVRRSMESLNKREQPRA
ncbi:MAG: hypothetical protein KF832_01475 [Caldilineaceae bacterium]|nr:hypothetical protein [Caldilineaceae bacterium]